MRSVSEGGARRHRRVVRRHAAVQRDADDERENSPSEHMLMDDRRATCETNPGLRASCTATCAPEMERRTMSESAAPLGRARRAREYRDSSTRIRKPREWRDPRAPG